MEWKEYSEERNEIVPLFFFRFSTISTDLCQQSVSHSKSTFNNEKTKNFTINIRGTRAESRKRNKCQHFDI
ncbi:hypothetical protein DERP_004180 [Dermatophagoides pteronyssinus]|uniref:Uncharacterized protein n=1 Tax=Dermatophagoides pteronyssinus TaxID=6956 RepID=A0ABQ8J8F8_DERPT|nr:hypothetical protein DERP_004180 [Dermatophagoides pteronyssinus]